MGTTQPELLDQKIQEISASQVAEAVKNLGIALQYDWKQQLPTDEEVRTALEGVQAEGESEALRQAILTGATTNAESERWGRSTLRYFAADPDLMPYVEEAVDDARETGVKVIDPLSLIILGTLLVLIKWRPSRFEKKGKDIKITWKDNDTKAVSDLANLVGGPGAI